MVKLVGVVSNDDDTKLWQNSRRSLQKISLQRSIAKGWPLVCGALRNDGKTEDLFRIPQGTIMPRVS